MDQLHIRRQVLETMFNRRKAQLEQCLALAILAADLRELEETVHHRRDMLLNSNQLGKDYTSSHVLYYKNLAIHFPLNVNLTCLSLLLLTPLIYVTQRFIIRMFETKQTRKHVL